MAPVLREDHCMQAGQVTWGQVMALPGKFNNGSSRQANDVCVLGALG